jgi:hypothetical protein
MASLLDHGFDQMDVPAFRKPIQIASRVTLIASAHAAEIPRPSASRAHPANWTVQVGTFSTEAAAHGAALATRREADGGEVRIEPVRLRGKTVWRAQVTGLTASDAQEACAGRRKAACMVIRPETRQIASR